MHDTLSMEAFCHLLGEEFSVYLGDSVMAATLLEVMPLNGSSSNPERQAWSMVFQFPPEQLFDQGTFEFEHTSTGRQAIFIVPIGQDEEGVRYQAIFN